MSTYPCNKERKIEWGYVEECERPSDVSNLNIYDTLTPMWLNRHLLSPQEKSMLYIIAILNSKLEKLNTALSKTPEER